MKLTDLIRAFKRGEVIGPNGPLQAEACIETLRAVLLFTSDAVIKVRRPIEVGGIDQRSMSMRGALAEQEKWIGRQIAPHVYLADASLRLEDGVELVAGTHEDCETIVAMRRQNDAVRADILATEPDRPNDLLYPVMEFMAEYHERSPIHRGHHSWGAPGHLPARIEAVMEALRPDDEAMRIISDVAYEHLVAETRGWLDELSSTLAHRVTEGRIREVHGDLRLEHIYLTDPIVVIDPAEGGMEEHILDIGEEICQLGMELDAIQWADVSEQTLNYYAGLASDATLIHVAPLYKRLHAMKRALSELEAARRSPPEDKSSALERGRFYVDLALSYGAFV